VSGYVIKCDKNTSELDMKIIYEPFLVDLKTLQKGGWSEEGKYMTLHNEP